MARGNHTGPRSTVPVLLVGTYRPAVAAVRALARRPDRRILVGTFPDRENIEGSGGAELSRHAHRRVTLPDHRSDPDGWLATIQAEAGRHSRPLRVLPFYEPAVVLLSANRARLGPDVRPVVPPQRVMEICVDKSSTLEAAHAAGLPSLPHRVVRTYEELLDVTSELGGVAIRAMPPRTRISQRKAILAATPADLRRELPAWPPDHERLLVQRLVRGPRVNVHYAARDGVVLGAVASTAGRTDALDGTGLGVEGVSRPVGPELGSQLDRLVASLGYHGVGLAQFLVDDRGSAAYLIEVNPRIGAHHVVADRLGLDLANLAVDLADGLDVEPVVLTDPARPVRLAWTLGDLAGLRRALGEGRVGRRAALGWITRMAVTAVRADVHATWSWRDPLPAAGVWWRYLVGGTGRVVTARLRR